MSVLFCACRLGGEHDFHVKASAFVEDFHYFAVGDFLVGIKSYEMFGIVLLRELEESHQLLVGERFRFFIAESGIGVKFFVNPHSCAGFHGSLFARLRQIHFKSRRENESRSHHKENKQQEYDIGHRCHIEHREHIVLTSECHDLK